jgi:hypothetical protein
MVAAYDPRVEHDGFELATFTESAAVVGFDRGDPRLARRPRVLEPEHGVKRGLQCLIRGRERSFSVMADRIPPTTVLGISPILLKPVGSVRTDEDVHAEHFSVVVDRAKHLVLMRQRQKPL